MVLDWVELVFLQFNPLGLFLGLIAAVPLQRRAPWFLLTSLASIVVLSTYSITYHTVDAKVLTIPTFVIFSISIGVGFLWAVSGFRSWVQKAVSASSTQTQRRVKASISPTIILATALTLVALPVTSVILNHETQDRSNDREAYDYARKIMASVPDGSLVMSTDEAAAFSLWYMSFVEDKERGIAAIAVPLL